MFIKKNIYNYYYFFLISHLIIWTLVPTFTNINLPLDTIEALAWGSNLDWGFNKHPPFSAFAVEMVYQLFGNQDWAYYFLSQLFVIIAFYAIFKLATEIFNNPKLAFFSVLILEGIIFYNFTTPEFNVNVSQLPFWALSSFFTWRCIKYKKTYDYVLLGIFVGFGILSKYLFLYLVLSIKLLFIYLIYQKKQIKFKNLFLASSVSLLIIFPHLIWLTKNDFITITYGLQRTGGVGEFKDHIIFPLTFILKQLVLLAPFLFLLSFLLKKLKMKIVKNDKTIYLFFICLAPIFFILLTSLILGSKIRTMWMTPFYLLLGILFIEIFKNYIETVKVKKFLFFFLLLFILSPLTYLIISLTNDSKRTDYPGEEVARLVQSKWNNNFRNEIKIVIGDEWFAGNLSYHLASRPKWIIDLNNERPKLKSNEGAIYTGSPKILKKNCPGIFETIKLFGYCMIGKK